MKNLVFLTLLCVASTLAEHLDPRGARPVEQGTRSDKCATEKEWPFCTDEQWGSKCPSGCRIQGLLDQYDHGTLKKIEKIRSLLDQNRATHRSADQVSKQTYDYLKEKLTLESGNDNSYFDLAQSLRTRITDMKIRIDRQLGALAALKQRVKDQVDDMQRLEIDIDIKLRSCKGSCQTYAKYDVDQDSLMTLQKQVDQLDSQAAQNIEAVGTLYVMKSRPLKSVVVDSVYKSGKGGQAQQNEDMFPEVKTVNLILELEGSSSSPATISKAPVCTRLQRQDGRQPSGHTHMKKHCRTHTHFPLCADDNWVSKCPSGCRLQGLISQMESKVERKLTKLCKTAKIHEDATEKSMAVMTGAYNHNRRFLVSRYVSELKFVEQSEVLALKLTSLRKRSSKLSLKLKEVNRDVQKQLVDLYRTEVEVDVQLRACSGSCKLVFPFSVDHHSFQTLQTDLRPRDKTPHQRRTVVSPPEDVPHMKLQTVDEHPTSPEYKSIPTVRRELLTQFEDIPQNRVFMEDLETEELH